MQPRTGRPELFIWTCRKSALLLKKSAIAIASQGNVIQGNFMAHLCSVPQLYANSKGAIFSHIFFSNVFQRGFSLNVNFSTRYFSNIIFSNVFQVCFFREFFQRRLFTVVTFSRGYFSKRDFFKCDFFDFLCFFFGRLFFGGVFFRPPFFILRSRCSETRVLSKGYFCFKGDFFKSGSFSKADLFQRRIFFKNGFLQK